MKTDNNLCWYHRDPDVPTSPTDRAVLRLVYASDGHETEMGLVCETSDGAYWCFTTNSRIVSMPMDSILHHHKTIEEAREKLYEYVVAEIIRLLRIATNMPYTIQYRFKKRDRVALKNYTEEISGDTVQAFKCGMDWILRSEGVPRRPAWAKFLTQNRDGTFVWHEDTPSTNDNTGRWESTGRFKEIRIAENWRSGILRLT